MDRLNREFAEISSGQQGTGYGVRNVNDKLKIVFGKDCGVQIESSEGEGTIVTLHIRKDGERFYESNYL